MQKIKDPLCDLNTNLWITANAGSGKTTQLVERFLFLLNNEIKPEEIICITYTEAGASEIKNRIINKISQNKTIINEKITIDSNKIQISTIHGLCKRLLITNKLLSNDVSILNNDKFTLDKIVKIIIDRLDNETIKTELQAPIEQIINNLSKTESITSLQDIVKNIIHNQLWFLSLFDKINTKKDINIFHGIDIGKINNLLPEDLQIFINKTSEINNEGITLQQLLAQYDINDLHNLIKEILGQKSNDFLNKNENNIQKLQSWKNIVLTTKNEPRKTVLKLPDEAHIETLAKRIQQYFIDKLRQTGIDATYSVLCLAFFVLKEYQEIKKQMNVNTYDDLLFLTFKMISENRLFNKNIKNNGSNIKFLMLDEAQDTSPISWKIIQHIIQTTKCNFFVVGDKKQSIYRFQGARVEEYEKNKNIFSNISKQLNVPFDDSIILDTSYRSIKPILDEADELCNNNKMAFTKNSSEKITHKCCLEKINQQKHGYILNKENSIITDYIEEPEEYRDENNDKNHNTSWYERTKKQAQRQKDRKQQARNVAEKLYNKYINTYLEDIKNNIIDPSISSNAIAIVYQYSTTKHDFVFDVISEMQDNFNVDVIMKTNIEKKNIYYNDIIAILNFFVLQNNNINTANMLKSDLFNFTDEMFTQICADCDNFTETNTLWQTLQTRFLPDKNANEKLKFAIQNLQKLLKCSTLNEIFLWTEELIRNKIQTNEKCKKYLYPMQIIKSCAQKNIDIHQYDIRSFLLSLESDDLTDIKITMQTNTDTQSNDKTIINNNIDNDVLNKNNNKKNNTSLNDIKPKIFFSTIHGVKGMEFDTVIFLNLKRKNNSNKNKMLFLDDCFWYKTSGCKLQDDDEVCKDLLSQIEEQKKQEENETLRLQYVAITRAKRRIIYIKNKEKIKKEKE